MDEARRAQAAMLRAAYYYVQITIHRPFIQLSRPSRRVSATSLPSLSICANAARSSCHILSHCMDTTPSTMLMMSAYMSGLVLTISIWEELKSDRGASAADLAGRKTDVHVCLWYLKKCETR